MRAFQAGADDFLVKPIEPATFLAHFLSVIRFRQIVGPSYGSYRFDPSPHTPSLFWYYFTFSRLRLASD